MTEHIKILIAFGLLFILSGAGIIPIAALLLLALLLALFAGSIATLKYFGILAPLYVQIAASTSTPHQSQTKPKALLDVTHFVTYVERSIDGLPLSAPDKKDLLDFTLNADSKLCAVFAHEGLVVSLTGIQFGALTVTFRLKLKELSRANLDRLMKLDAVIAQALLAETVRLTQRQGYIECEVSSPVRAVVTARSLDRYTHGMLVPFGLDTQLQPALVDLSQHGLIAAIAPSRRGKTQAIRTVLYLLKRANPDVTLVVMAFKRADWQAFDGIAHLIPDSNGIAAFTRWMLSQMYEKARQPDNERWIIVFDDLVNLLATNPDLPEMIKQFASLGAGVGVTTIVSTQFSGKDSGGTATFANATCRLMFKPSSNLQGSRDGGFAGLGLDQLSTQKGDALLLVDGEAQRIATAMTSDAEIMRLPVASLDPVWLTVGTGSSVSGTTQGLSLSLHPMDQLIEKLDGDLYDIFDFEQGKFINAPKALTLLGWHNNGHYRRKLAQLETHIAQQQ